MKEGFVYLDISLDLALAPLCGQRLIDYCHDLLSSLDLSRKTLVVASDQVDRVKKLGSLEFEICDQVEVKEGSLIMGVSQALVGVDRVVDLLRQVPGGKTVDLRDLIKEDDWSIHSFSDLVDRAQRLQKEINEGHLQRGVLVVDPVHTAIGVHVSIGQGSIIYPHVTLVGSCRIADHVTITGDSWIENSSLASGVVIESSKIIDSDVLERTHIGPYSHLRMGSLVGPDVRIGNFVELKKTSMGQHSHASHLSYLGDSIVGDRVNVGCGVVTVNYDGGPIKHTTQIKDGAFIGCNSNLIAPITIGKNAVVGAGSTLTDNVGDGELHVERASVVVRPQGGLHYKEKKGKK